MSSSVPAEPRATRRAVVVGGCAGALAACLAGCARYGDQGGSAPPPEAAGSAGSGASAPGSVAVADVPVGGGIVLADQGVVVTQPTAGTFAAFGATCPHQGCSVNEVSDGLIKCPCHGSEFTIADGGVATGPAKRGLPRRQAAAQGGQVRIT